MTYIKPCFKSYIEKDFYYTALCQYTGSLTITFRQAEVAMNNKPTPIIKICSFQETNKIIGIS